MQGTGNPGVQGISPNGHGVEGSSGAAIPTSPGTGVAGTSSIGYGVEGISSSSTGVRGQSTRDNGAGVQGTSASGPGVDGRSTSGFGVQGTSTSSTGVRGRSTGSGNGVYGSSGTGIGLNGYSANGTGVRAEGGQWGVMPPSGGPGVAAYCYASSAVFAQSVFGDGIEADTSTRAGVRGRAGSLISSAKNGVGVYGTSTMSGGAGVRGEHNGSANGVEGTSGSGNGVEGTSARGSGVQGTSSTGAGVYGRCLNPSLNVTDRRVGGVFEGGVIILGGLKPFVIDHPLDPQNRYLVHTSVESSEMKNVYDGVARLDKDGAAWVDLPEWFEALNGDFRYQLTAIGGPAPNLHVAEEISENRFKIAAGEEGMKVCWQVTGSRKDPWAEANPFEVEQEKREEEQGRYLDPSLYDAPEEQRVMIGPAAEAVEEAQRPPEPAGIDFARLEEEHQRLTNELRRPVEE